MIKERNGTERFGSQVAALLGIRDTIRKIYADYDGYLRPVLKFLFALCCLLSINLYLGYLPVLNRLPVVLIGALFCSVTPPGTVAFVAAVFALGHVSEVSLVSAALLFLLFVLIGGLYLGFRPKGAFLLALIPLCFLWNIPFVIPVVLGLSVGVTAIVPSFCAVPVWFLLRFVHEHAEGFQNSTDLGVLTAEFSTVAGGVFRDRYLYVMLLCFAVTILAVAVIRRLSVDHAWTIAVFAGILCEVLIGLVGGMVAGGGNFLFDLIGIAVSLGLALLYEILFFAVDYRGTERLQFEDDDYYYYVKAVPKIRFYEEEERFE